MVVGAGVRVEHGRGALHPAAAADQLQRRGQDGGEVRALSRGSMADPMERGLMAMSSRFACFRGAAGGRGEGRRLPCFVCVADAPPRGGAGCWARAPSQLAMGYAVARGCLRGLLEREG